MGVNMKIYLRLHARHKSWVLGRYRVTINNATNLLMHESISIYLNKLYHYSILCDAPLDVAICHTISHEYIHSALFHIGEEKASKAFDNIADIKDWRTRTGAGLPL